MNEGKIVKLVRQGGFGFVRPLNKETDIFFHHSNVEDVYFEDLTVGDVVAFVVENTPKGPEAIKIIKQLDSKVQFRQNNSDNNKEDNN